MASLADSGKHAPTRTPVKKSSKNAPGGKPELYDYLLSVTADVKNGRSFITTSNRRHFYLTLFKNAYL